MMMPHSGASSSDVIIDLISDEEDGNDEMPCASFRGASLEIPPSAELKCFETVKLEENVSQNQRKVIKEESLSQLEVTEVGISSVNGRGVAGNNGSSAATDISNGRTSTLPLHASIAQMPGVQVSRCFWKAGDYELGTSSSSKSFHNGMDHVRVHPKFLHSNATSHKWALGAIAELLDNAVDEIRNGATFVSADKVANPRDNSPCILIQDDGGGMDPECLRQCMSLGYSRKTSKTSIGQYGNGFKTSTMRLGADVIVFTRCSGDSGITQSIGLMSYTFLRATGQEDIVVPMVDFEISPTDGKPTLLLRGSHNDWIKNLSLISEWSPFVSESDLLKQFDDIGWHGTKIILYNLWLNDDGELELDFDTDKEDIQLRGAPKIIGTDSLQKQLTHQHVASRLRYSLRAYASILYLHIPSNFQIILRGKVVEHKRIVDDLKFTERILYKPQVGSSRDREVSVITAIGFAKEAPMVNVHGFNIYHKNRLIMPFWKVFTEGSSRGKGVVGVLEANFIEPAHDKQDFERTPMLQRLETRLKQMTIEYWNLHCELIGYQAPRSKLRAPSCMTPPGVNQFESSPHNLHSPAAFGALSDEQRLELSDGDGLERMASTNARSTGLTHNGVSLKRTVVQPCGTSKRQEFTLIDLDMEPLPACATDVAEEVRQLRLRCVQYEQTEKELKTKIARMESELLEYKRLVLEREPSLSEVEPKLPKQEL